MYLFLIHNIVQKFLKVPEFFCFFLRNYMYIVFIFATQMKEEKKENIHYKTLLKPVERN